ncbi:DUF642 domain-containing protein [Aliiglaciecola sp. CAU 1673]|uniref:DUF642 domain-containing protein n=1 Tax=Aliiglaciecola sp. CAU 1673 TaxID=3032595 RepID=UPI0023DA8C77|nr:DUF642 domain-containing protein [Aliiglaciecola sp. CAU 1673]MDF2176830.1 DUF642 domain-containing protein [Aliiglaciecola sp. CAU 1673]
MKSAVIALLALGCALLSYSTSANLIINGGFEDNNVKTNTWAWFTADKVPGWEGSNIEIWDTYQKFQAFDGTQHAELNAHGGNGTYSIFQTFATEIGGLYELSFAYAARSKISESFRVDLSSGKDTFWSQVFTYKQVKSWATFDYQFKALSAFTTLQFTALTKGTVGNFLDAVSVFQIKPPVTQQTSSTNSATAVPEPFSLSVFLIGLMALAFALFRNNPPAVRFS